MSPAFRPQGYARGGGGIRFPVYAHYDDKQREFLDFVLDQYINQGVGELDQDKLPALLELSSIDSGRGRDTHKCLSADAWALCKDSIGTLRHRQRRRPESGIPSCPREARFR